MKRIGLFLLTNLAIVFVLGIVVQLLGLEPALADGGLNLPGLLGFAAVFGMGGAFISLAMSKWSAKRMTGARGHLVDRIVFKTERGHGKMIAALRRLQAAHAPALSDKLAAFGIAGQGAGGLKRLFMTHPPLEERIAALEAAGQREGR